jgi:hypothetical protein
MVMRLLPPVPLRAALGFAFLCALTLGCRDGIRGVPVKGKVVKNGQLVRLQEGDTLVIYLVSTEEGRRVRSLAIYKPADGTFACNGPTRQGVPEGKHRIELYPGKADFPPYVDYLFNGEFKGDKTPLEITLTEGNSQSLVVDVGTKTVTAP